MAAIAAQIVGHVKWRSEVPLSLLHASCDVEPGPTVVAPNP